MKSFEQLAQSAYEAFSKERLKRGTPAQQATWDELTPSGRECWIAAAKQLWAEFAAIH